MNAPFVTAVLHAPAHKPLHSTLNNAIEGARAASVGSAIATILYERASRFAQVFKPVITWSRDEGYAPVGYVCPQTGRVAVSVKQFANSDLNGNATAYWFGAEAESYGMDPWRVVEGVDPYIDGTNRFDVWFEGASGCKRIDIDTDRDNKATFFVSAKDAALLAREFA